MTVRFINTSQVHNGFADVYRDGVLVRVIIPPRGKRIGTVERIECTSPYVDVEYVEPEHA